jgi:hypothetical protein
MQNMMETPEELSLKLTALEKRVKLLDEERIKAEASESMLAEQYQVLINELKDLGVNNVTDIAKVEADAYAIITERLTAIDSQLLLVENK